MFHYGLLISDAWSMKAEFQSMNPADTDDSFLLRFEDVLERTTHCILVDCGENVDVDEFLGENDELSGIVITHAHEDHISSLPENARPGIPIYTSPQTAAILETIFTEAANVGKDDHLTDDGTWPFWQRITPDVAETVTNQLTPITEFTQVTPHVDVRPLPAGHTPGASSFLFKLIDGQQNRYFLATGDFTRHSVGTNPGLTTDIAKAVDIDAVFLNSSVRDSDDYSECLTDSLGSMIEHAIQGKKVLVPASSLTGVHYAYWVGEIVSRSSSPVNVRVAGLAAKLYRQLGYNDSNVELVPDYDASEIIDNGTIVITAPEVPTAGGSGEIHSLIKSDPNAVTIQIKSGGDTKAHNVSVDESYRFLPHPTLEGIDGLIESLNPAHMIVNHGPKNKFKDRYPFTIHWTIKNHHKVNTFLDNGKLVKPDWVSRGSARETRRKHAARCEMVPDPAGESSLPNISTQVNTLDAAGISEDDLPATILLEDPSNNTDDADPHGESVSAPTTEQEHNDHSKETGEELNVGPEARAEPVESPPDSIHSHDDETVAVAQNTLGEPSEELHPESPPGDGQNGKTSHVTASDGGAAIHPMLGDPEAFDALPDETTVTLIKTLQDVQRVLADQLTTGQVLAVGENGTVTIDVNPDAVEHLDEGDTVSLTVED